MQLKSNLRRFRSLTTVAAGLITDLLILRLQPLQLMALDSQVILSFCSIPRLCHREECKVLGKQPEQQAGDQPGDVRPSLLQEARLHPLDVQPDLPGRQVLDEDLRQWKNEVYNRLNFGSEGLWRKRLLSSRSQEHSSSCYGKLQSSMDLPLHRLLPLPRVELHLV